MAYHKYQKGMNNNCQTREIIEKAKEIGLKIEQIEDNQKFQDIVLFVFMSLCTLLEARILPRLLRITTEIVSLNNLTPVSQPYLLEGNNSKI